MFELLFCPVHGIIPRFLAIMDLSILHLTVRMAYAKVVEMAGRLR